MSHGCRFECSQLGYHFFKKERRLFLGWQILLCLDSWGPKELAEPESSSISLKKMTSTNNVVRKPLIKEGRKYRTKVPKTQCLPTPCVLKHKCQCSVLKNCGDPLSPWVCCHQAERGKRQMGQQKALAVCEHKRRQPPSPRRQISVKQLDFIPEDGNI